MTAPIPYTISKHIAVVRELFALHRRRLDQKALRTALARHPDYPQLSAVIDAIRSLGFECQAGRVPARQLAQLTHPFFALSLRHGLVLVREITADQATYFTADDGWIQEERSAFDINWNGIIILVDMSAAGTSGGHWLKHSLAVLRSRGLAVVGASWGLVLLGGLSLSLASPWLMTGLLLSLAGISVALLIFSMRTDREVREKFCSSKEAGSCTSVLESSYAKIAGVEWSEIGLAYFAGQFCLLLGAALFASPLFPMAWAFSSLLALAFVPYSLYVQAIRLRSWCRFCLLTLAVTVGMAGASTAYLLSVGVSWSSWFGPAGLLVFGSTLLGARELKRSMKRSTQQTDLVNRYHRLIGNHQVFQAIQGQQDRLNGIDQIPAISLFQSPLAAHTARIVIAPLCERCAEKFRDVLALLEKGDLRFCLEVIITPGKDPKVSQSLVSWCMDLKPGDRLKLLADWFAHRDLDRLRADYPSDEKVAQRAADYLKACERWMAANKLEKVPLTILDKAILSEHYSLKEVNAQLAAARA